MGDIPFRALTDVNMRTRIHMDLAAAARPASPVTFWVYNTLVFLARPHIYKQFFSYKPYSGQVAWF